MNSHKMNRQPRNQTTTLEPVFSGIPLESRPSDSQEAALGFKFKDEISRPESATLSEKWQRI